MRQKNIHRDHLKVFVDYAALRGIKPDQLLSVLSDPAREVVREDEFWQVLTTIHAAIPDALLGIYAGRTMSVKALGLIYNISIQCTTILEALLYLQSYITATLPVIDLDVREESGHIRIDISPLSEKEITHGFLCDALLTIIEQELRLMCKGKIEIACTSPGYNPDYPDNWRYGNSYSLMACDIILVSSLHHHFSWNLAPLVTGYLALIENMQQERNDFVSRVKVMALSMSDPELPTLSQLAANFNLTPRSFQRKLENAGSSYRKVRDALHRDISFFLSQHKTYKVSDIATILGYAESSAYIRAKKRWQTNDR